MKEAVSRAPSPEVPPAKPEVPWLSAREAGSMLGMRAVFVLTRVLGRRWVHPLLWAIAAYYVIARRQLRRDMRSYWRRLGQPSTLGLMIRHVFRFAQCTLDRTFFWQDDTRWMTIMREGHPEQVLAQVDAGRGGLFVGAHLGSFDALRVLGRGRKLPLHILVHYGNARKIAALLRGLGTDDEHVRLLEIEPGSPAGLLRVQELIEKGHFVGILADRVGLNHKRCKVDFLGSPAEFPTGPWVLASLLRCPVFLVFGLFVAPRTYRVIVEPFADPVDLRRSDKEASLRATVAAYAARVEHYCRQVPDNWFNFFDFWQDERERDHESAA